MKSWTKRKKNASDDLPHTQIWRFIRNKPVRISRMLYVGTCWHKLWPLDRLIWNMNYCHRVNKMDLGKIHTGDVRRFKSRSREAGSVSPRIPQTSKLWEPWCFALDNVPNQLPRTLPELPLSRTICFRVVGGSKVRGRASQETLSKTVRTWLEIKYTWVSNPHFLCQSRWCNYMCITMKGLQA